jgi:hypothetical protein
VNFEEYLSSKKIDYKAFQKAEPVLYHAWQTEFGQMHANSFTVQKLNLINPIRRKYQLKELAPPPVPEKTSDAPAPVATPAAPAARPGKPVIKPKPKFN